MSHAGEGRYSMPAGFTRPRLGMPDALVLLWRAKWLMIAVFLPLLAAGLAGAAMLPAQYTAETRLIVSPERGAMVRAELDLLCSPAVAHRALAKVSLARAYPEIARGCTGEACAQLAAVAIAQRFVADAAAESTVITARFTHGRAEMAAEMLNAMAEGYLEYRADVFAEVSGEGLSEQLARAEQDLSDAEAAIRDYLVGHELTDLAAERETLQQLGRAAKAELFQTQSRLRQAQAQLAGYEAQLARLAPEQVMRTETAAALALATLKREREEKMSRYLPDSRVIQDLNRRIAQAESDVAAEVPAEDAAVRVPNPAYQQVDAMAALLRADVRAMRAQEAALSSQTADFEARLRQLMDLVLALTQLERQREMAEAALRAVQDRSYTEGVGRSGEAVRLLDKAEVPVKDESLKVPAAILALTVAFIAALGAGLVHAFTRRGLATPGSAQRTLGLPVVAAVRKY